MPIKFVIQCQFNLWIDELALWGNHNSFIICYNQFIAASQCSCTFEMNILAFLRNDNASLV